MKSPLELFMGLGNKVTKGDPKRMMDFSYYMMWIIFIAFFAIFIGNIRLFLTTWQLQYLGWCAFSIAIMWFQYNSLANIYQQRKLFNSVPQEKPEEIELDSVEEMKQGFE